MANEASLAVLEKRLGRRYARQRLGIEKDHEAQLFGHGLNFFHIENLPLWCALIRAVLMASGLYWRGVSNAANVEVKHHRISLPRLPASFDGFTILQLSDLHVDISVLISHTPEIYRQAAHADFDLLLSGHTHGGQICLPGGIPITLDSALPRSLGSGPWKYHDMIGYTSVGAGTSILPARFNCPPEITLHHLQPPRSASAT
jgi:predicted MPP superfamily phosphohydrolase